MSLEAPASAASSPGPVAITSDAGAQHGCVRASDRQRKTETDEMLRVDHAGEVGAVAIYEGQMWMLRGTPAYQEIVRMRQGEIEHLDTMERLVSTRRARPTLLLPLWRAAGFMLGAGTALLGPQSAMACTVAVETVIGQHYNEQIRHLLKEAPAGGKLPADDAELAAVFKKHRDEELEHLDTGLKWDAEKAPAYDALTQVIKLGCTLAISVVRRI